MCVLLVFRQSQVLLKEQYWSGYSHGPTWLALYSSAHYCRFVSGPGNPCSITSASLTVILECLGSSLIRLPSMGC